MADQTPAYLVDPAGKVFSTTADQQEGLLEGGNTVASPDEIAAFQRKQQLQSLPAMAATAELGLARTATFGLSDVVGKAAGAEGAINDLANANPGSDLIGQGLGFISPEILATIGSAAEKAGIKGAGKVGKFVGEYLTAPGLARKAGEAAGSATEKALGKEVVDLAGPSVDLGEARESAARFASGAQQDLAQAIEDQSLVRAGLIDATNTLRDLKSGVTTAINPAAIEAAEARVKELGEVAVEAGQEVSRAQKALADAPAAGRSAIYPDVPEIPEGTNRVSGVLAGQGPGEFKPPLVEGADQSGTFRPLSGTFSVENGQPVLTPFLAKATDGILPSMAAGATEFGLYGLGNVISEAALQDPEKNNYDLSTSGILGTIGTSALFGGALTGLGKGFTGVLGATLEKAANADTGVTFLDKYFRSNKKLSDLLNKTNLAVGGASPEFENRANINAQTRWEMENGLIKKTDSLKNLLDTPGPFSTRWKDVFDGVGKLAELGWASDTAPILQGIAHALRDDREHAGSENGPVARAEATTQNFVPNAVENMPPVAQQVVSDAWGDVRRAMSPSLLRNGMLTFDEVLNKAYTDLSGHESESTFTSLMHTLNEAPENASIKDKMNMLYKLHDQIEEMQATFGAAVPKEIRIVRAGIEGILRDEGVLGRGAEEYLEARNAIARARAAQSALDHDIAEKVLNRNGTINYQFTEKTIQDIIDADPSSPAGAAKVNTIQKFYNAQREVDTAISEFREASGRYDYDPKFLESASRKAQSYHFQAAEANEAAARADAAFREQLSRNPPGWSTPPPVAEPPQAVPQAPIELPISPDVATPAQPSGAPTPQQAAPPAPVPPQAGAAPVVGNPAGQGGLGSLLGGALGAAAFQNLAGTATHLATSSLGIAGIGALASKAIPKLFKYALDNPGEAAYVLSSLYGIAENTSKTIERGAASIVSTRQKGAGRGEALPGVQRVFSKDTPGIRKVYEKAVSSITRNTNDTGEMIDNMTRATEGLSKYAPGLAQSMTTTAALAASYLAAKIPQAGRAGTFGPKLEVPESEMAKFLNIKDIVDYPQHIIGAMKAGTMTPDMVQALKNVHGEYYSKLTSNIVTEMEAAKHSFTGTQSLMFSMLLGTDATGTIGSTLKTQINFASGTQTSAQQPKNSGAAKLTVAERTTPGSTKTANREAA